jgi:LPPG:FO 2-phospho-L-lactate transferase
VQTRLHTTEGVLAFQDYFVKRRCEPAVHGLEYAGADAAAPSRGLAALMQGADIRGIVICPSNPFLSIEPILAVPGVRAWLRNRAVPSVAVSPLIGGKAVKGPAAKMLAELGMQATPQAIAAQYDGLIDGLVIDRADAALGFGPCHVTDTLMRNVAGQERLARDVLHYLDQLITRQ